MDLPLYPVPCPGPGRLFVMPAPPGGPSLRGALALLRTSGIDVVASLLMPEEAEAFGLADERSLCGREGIDFAFLPVPDRSVPPSAPEAGALVDRLVEGVKAGRSVAVHCVSALGRSPLIAACILIRLGKTADEAVALLSSARGCRVPQLDEQQEWVRAFANGGLRR